MNHAKRRKFLITAGALLTAHLTAEAQQAGKVNRVGVLWHAGSREEEGPMFDAFTAGLRERGYVDGRNIVLEHRFPGEMPERFRSMAAELVALKPDLLVGVGPGAVALKNTGTSIPIVFTAVGDPVVGGLVRNFPRPGENITGFTMVAAGMNGKRLQLLLEFLPATKRVGVLHNPDSLGKELILREVTSATQALGLEPRLVEARNGGEIDLAFVQFARRGIKAALIVGDPLLWREREHIARAAIAAGIATSHFSREGAEAGSLFSYGTNIAEVIRQTSDYVVKILRGARPGDLPVVQPTRFELVINLKTARTLGLTIPQSLLLRADRVIE